MAQSYLTLNKAMLAMQRPDASLIKMHVQGGGSEWFVTPKAGPVKPSVAAAILARPDVVGMEDGLFPGCSQSYRIAR
jgi:hypothetical protein